MKKSLLTLAVATICLSGCGKNEDGLKSKKEFWVIRFR